MSHLNLTLRSLFRHKLMTDRNYPSILIDTESTILKNRIKYLSFEEKEFIENNFNSLYNEYLKNMELSDFLFAEELDRTLHQMN